MLNKPVEVTSSPTKTPQKKTVKKRCRYNLFWHLESFCLILSWSNRNMFQYVQVCNAHSHGSCNLTGQLSQKLSESVENDVKE